MQRKFWLGAAAGAFAMVAMAAAPQAAPVSAGASDITAAAPRAAGVQNVHWYRRHYRGYRYWPRRHYWYGYRYHRPYRYYGYGYGPRFGFYAGPRFYRRWWW